MTPQYPQFELVWSTLSTTSSVSTFPFIPASNTQNEEAFEDGMNEKIAETEDAVKKGIEKPGVQIHADAENSIKSGFNEDLRKHWKTI